MARLRTLPTRLATISQRLKSATTHGQDWRAWYSTAEWRRLRIAVFKRDGFQCQCGCGRVEGDTRLLVCDHIRAHRGRRELFYDPANLQTLLKSCHDSRKQRAENRLRRGGYL